MLNRSLSKLRQSFTLHLWLYRKRLVLLLTLRLFLSPNTSPSVTHTQEQKWELVNNEELETKLLTRRRRASFNRNDLWWNQNPEERLTTIQKETKRHGPLFQMKWKNKRSQAKWWSERQLLKWLKWSSKCEFSFKETVSDADKCFSVKSPSFCVILSTLKSLFSQRLHKFP